MIADITITIATSLAYAQALESLTSPRLSPRELKRRKRMIYQAKRGNVSGAKRIAQYLISRDLLTSVELLIFGREIELLPDQVIKQVIKQDFWLAR